MSESDVVIRVEGLGKKYSLHHEQSERYTALRDVVARQAKAAGRLLNPFTLAGQLRKAQRQAAQDHAASEEEFWALKDVSFEIRRGERVGIIGRNGAGKSTLLKILSRITEPTTGRVEIRGRVASLLEVGTGFHPELTGRENIYLNGAILGMTRREIRSKFDEIVTFAEVAKFLDTPVKRYSSGMYVRLAFAVAAHLEPEILVVDEVLAVGDASFQKKCLGKMEEVSEEQGRTVLFVSHNMAAVKQLCSAAIVIKDGSLSMRGEPNWVVGSYLGGEQVETSRAEWPSLKQSPGDEMFRIRKIEITNSTNSAAQLAIEQPVDVRIFYDMIGVPDRSMLTIDVSIHLKTNDGVVVLATWNTRVLKDSPVVLDSDNRAELVDICVIPAHFLNDTNYYLDAFVLSNTIRFHAVVRDSVLFSPIETERKGNYLGEIIGVVRPRLTWSTHQLVQGVTR
jgi:lipopolysaccharide transport system ATP-binding protein